MKQFLLNLHIFSVMPPLLAVENGCGVYNIDVKLANSLLKRFERDAIVCAPEGENNTQKLLKRSVPAYSLDLTGLLCYLPQYMALTENYRHKKFSFDFLL